MTTPLFEYERFFDMSPDLLCIAGYDGYFKKINAAVPKALGFSFEELYARPIDEFIYPEDRMITSQIRNEIIKSKPIFNFENRYVRKSGEIIWLAWTAQPIEDSKLVFAIAKDITHKKKIEGERNALLEKTDRIYRNLKQLNFTASHDLRSPVNNLMSIMELLNTIPIADPDILELHELMKNSMSNLKITLDNHVDLLKETQSPIASREKIDLESVINKVTQSIKSLIDNARAEISVDFRAFKEVKFNKANLESIFLNLMSNSIKYSRPGVPPKIKFTTQVLGKEMQLLIEDNGLGLDTEVWDEKIFGFGKKSSEKKDSKGVGLYLIYNHIIYMGGKITFKSKINEGTTFIITFKN